MIPSWPRCERGPEEADLPPGRAVTRRGTTSAGGHQLAPAPPSRRSSRLVEQRAAVQVEQVEEERSERQLVRAALDVEPAAEAAHRDLERVRGAVGPERDGLAVEDELAGGKRPHRFDQLGHRGGDVVEPAGDRPRTSSPALVDLDPGAVELVLQRRLAQLVERHRRRPRPSPRQHRVHRPEELGGEARELRGSPRQRRPGYAGQVARHHPGPPHRSGGHLRGARHRLDHQPLERALAELAHDQPEEEALLCPRGAGEELTQEALALGRRALARGHSGDPFEDRIHLRELEAGQLRRHCPGEAACSAA